MPVEIVEEEGRETTENVIPNALDPILRTPVAFSTANIVARGSVVTRNSFGGLADLDDGLLDGVRFPILSSVDPSRGNG